MSTDRPWVHQSGRLCALDLDFGVRTTDLAMGQYLDRVFRPFARPGTPARLYSVVVPPGSGDCQLELDGDLIFESSPASAVVSHLLWDVNRRVVAASSARYLLVHAAAAEYRGIGILLPARMESGKTTLVAGLVRAGLGYLTDEAAAINPDDLTIRPFPKALSLDPGSWAVLPDLEPRDPGQERYGGAQWQVDPDAIRLGAIAGPCLPGFVVAPSYRPGADTVLAPLSGAQAVVLLTENSFNLNQHGRRALFTYAAVVRRSSCWRLTIGNLDEACRLVLELLSRSRPST